MIGEKTTVLFICKQKRFKLIVFILSIQFCDESGVAILNYELAKFNFIQHSLELVHVGGGGDNKVTSRFTTKCIKNLQPQLMTLKFNSLFIILQSGCF